MMVINKKVLVEGPSGRAASISIEPYHRNWTDSTSGHIRSRVFSQVGQVVAGPIGASGFSVSCLRSDPPRRHHRTILNAVGLVGSSSDPRPAAPSSSWTAPLVERKPCPLSSPPVSRRPSVGPPRFRQLSSSKSNTKSLPPQS